MVAGVIGGALTTNAGIDDNVENDDELDGEGGGSGLDFESLFRC